MSTEVERIVANVLQRFDGNNDGEISWSEFHAALLAEQVDEDTIVVIRQQVFANWDTNADQKLSPPEIQALAHKWASFPGEQSSS